MSLTLFFSLIFFNLTNYGAVSHLFINPVRSIGYDAALNNPANLKLRESPKYSLRLASVNLLAQNNLLSFDSYNRYLGVDSPIDDEQKQELFNMVPASGIFLKGDWSLGLCDFSYRNLGFAFRRKDFWNVEIARDMVDLLLFGNQLNRTYQINNFSLDNLSYYSFNFAAGLQIINQKNQYASAGIGVKYLVGNNVRLTEQAIGNLYSNEYYLQGNLLWQRKLANGGYGLGIDLGGTYDLKKYRFSIALLNLSPGILWNRNPRTNIKTIALDSFSVYQAIKTNDLDSFYLAKDTTFPSASFRTSLPIYLTLGAGWKFDVYGSMLSVIYEQNLVETRFSTFAPKFSLDLQWNLLQYIIINPSISFDGNEGVSFALGIGKNIRRFLLGISLESIRTPVITKAKGLKFGLSIGVSPP